MTIAPPLAPLLEVRNLRKSFGHVLALQGANLTVRRGEVHALLGDNGAGKSTMLKILAGVYKADSGQILLNGTELKADNPRAVHDAGIETVFQDLSLAPSLNAGENVFLGREILRRGLLGRLGFVDRPAMQRRCAERLAELGVELPSLSAPVSLMSGGQRQAVAVARAAVWGRSMLLLDEPTAALGVKQTAYVLDLIRQVRQAGLTVLLISHKLNEVFAVADRVTVLRLGQTVLECPIGETNVQHLTLAMAGIEEASS
jgi:simple sugar transport system ATP-binding protein